MKKLLLLIVFIAINMITWAQSDAFNYQGIARATNGDPIANSPLGIRISIMSASATGTVVYAETHSPTTNNFGLFNIAIGNGSVVSGSLATINWGASTHYVKIEMDPAGGSAYTDLGTSQLLTVPYAKQASALNIYQSGTSNPNKVVIGHSPNYQDWGLIYDDSDDRFVFISSSIPVFSVNLADRSISLPMTSAQAGHVLVSTNANGTANWENRSTKITSITIPGCQTLASVNHNFAKIADLGTFVKSSAASHIELNLSTRFSLGSLSGATGVIYEIRIDNTASTNGNGTIIVKNTTEVTGIIQAFFSNLSTGTHTVSIWARTPFSPGTATNVYYDNGCWSTGNSLIVKEFH